KSKSGAHMALTEAAAGGYLPDPSLKGCFRCFTGSEFYLFALVNTKRYAPRAMNHNQKVSGGCSYSLAMNCRGGGAARFPPNPRPQPGCLGSLVRRCFK